MVPEWKKKFDVAVKAAEAEASKLRCPKTKIVSEYLGSFAERDVRVQCQLDRGHFGDCVVYPEAVERMEDPHPRSAMDILNAHTRP